jgi:hypothetical protein
MVRIDVPPRLLWLGAVLAGMVHLLVPGRLLETAAWAYRRFLAVEFDPNPEATRRVRLVGVGLLAVAAVLRWLLDR